VEVVVEDGSTFREFQTDGAANEGQSGGMIVNSKGEVIGIFNAGYLGGDNMGYGVPISTAIPVLQELINRETRDAVEEHGYMGIAVVAVSSEASNYYNIPEGAFIYEVSEGSAGEEAGLKKGDIIVGFDGITIDSKETLLRQITYYEPGEEVEVKVMRQGADGYEEKSFQVKLEEAPEDIKNQPSQQSQEPKLEIVPELPGSQGNPFDGFFGGEDE
jgi:serine protease Do